MCYIIENIFYNTIYKRLATD